MHLCNLHFKNTLKHIKPLRHVSIFSDNHQGVSSFLAKFITYSRFGSFLWTRCCGSISCCVQICCRECSWLGVLSSIRSTPSQLHSLQQITQHDMLPQHLVHKNEPNREYVITSARDDETPWWWSEKIETCGSGFMCFKWKLYRRIFWLMFEVILRNARCNGEIHNLLNILNYNFSKEQFMLPENDRVIETRRSVLSVLM